MIRSLLIDNYDSYTYNLFDLMTRVFGTEPVVLRHDDPVVLAESGRTDCVVISPGPGSPVIAEDFGHCAAVLKSAKVPVLGVCLGHQGIGAQFGALVTSAPEPRHGHVSQVRHVPDPLFSGIPQDFPVVRYHSLQVSEPLPADLMPLAWSEDDVLMALRHRSRPLWGVQFHPESVLTDHGETLMRNFAALVAAYHGRDPEGSVPDDRYRAHVRRVEFLPDGPETFSTLFGTSRHAVWLDSVTEGPGTGRFSYLAEASDVLGEVLTYRRQDGEVSLGRSGGQTRVLPGSVFTILEIELARRNIDAPAVPFDFTGGFIGYLGYELKADTGSRARHVSEIPDAALIFPDHLVVFDHHESVTYLLALSTGQAESLGCAERWLAMAERTVRNLPASGPLPGIPAALPALRSRAERALLRDRDRYLADIAECQQLLRAGETYEICLTNTLRLRRPADSFGFYRRLRRRNPAPYAAYLALGEVEVACSSPERFLKITADRLIEAKPIKGTAPRGSSPEEDAIFATALSSSLKSRAENLMIVDLLRNDLSRVCSPGSVHVPALMRVESYATVHQLVSTIRGSLRQNISAVAAVRACFPGGSMTGAPKLRTMEFIDELETSARGVYSGGIGFLACNGTADLNIVIRSAVFAQDAMTIGAGGAIVLDSDAEAEYEEMLLKALAPLRAYGEEEPAQAEAGR